MNSVTTSEIHSCYLFFNFELNFPKYGLIFQEAIKEVWRYSFKSFIFFKFHWVLCGIQSFSFSAHNNSRRKLLEAFHSGKTNQKMNIKRQQHSRLFNDGKGEVDSISEIWDWVVADCILNYHQEFMSKRYISKAKKKI